MARWDQSDLVRRVVGALDVAARLLGGPLIERVVAEKVVAEAAMLLFAVADARRLDPALEQGVLAVTELLLPRARTDQVLAGICLDPGLARDHAVAHLILARLGHPAPAIDRLLSESLSLGPNFGPERLAHRELEQDWLDRLRTGDPGSSPTEAATIARSSLGRPLDALGSSLFDRYAFTHAVLYASDFGTRRPALRRPPAEIAADADAALAASLDTGHLDLTAELLWAGPMLRLGWTPSATFAFQLLTAAQDDFGFLPGPGFSAATYRSLGPAERSDYALASSYHSDFVLGFLCAAALRPDCAPATVITPAGSPGATDDLWPALTEAGAQPAWCGRLRALPTAQHAALAPLLLTIALRRAATAGDLIQLRTLLATAVQHQLTTGPATEQAAALVRRSITLAGMTKVGAPNRRISVQS